MTLVVRNMGGKEVLCTRTLVGVRNPVTNKVNPVAWKYTPITDQPTAPVIPPTPPIVEPPVVEPPPPYTPPPPANQRLTILLNWENTQLTRDYMNSVYGTWVRDAVRFWQNCVTGLRYNSHNITLNVNIAFRSSLINNVLGIAGPGNGNLFGGMTSVGGITDAISALRLNDPYATVERATVHFNTAHYKLNPSNQQETNRKNAFFVTCVHELWHCLGGGMWNGDYRIVSDMGILGRWKLPSFPTALTPAFPHNNLTTGDPHNVRYNGRSGRNEALQAWRRTMQGRSGDAGIYIENFGMKSNTTMANAGTTAGGHWKQAYQSPTNTSIGAQTTVLSGVRDNQGRDMIHECMTGWSSADPTYVDNVWVGEFSVGTLNDIGYSVSYSPLSVPLLNYKSV